VTSYKELGLLPERGDQRWSTAHPTQGAASMMAQLPKRLGTQVWQLMMLPVSPQILHRIQLGSVRGQELDRQAPATLGNELLDQTTPVLAQPIPDHEQPPGEVPQQVTEELHYLRSPDGPPEKLEVEPPPRHSCDRREVVPVKVVLQDRSLSSWSPGAADVGSLTQPALVDEDDGPTFFASFFLMAGQRYLFQCRMASSSRSKARPVGRWQLQPNCPRILQTCPGWYRTPHRLSMRSATRAAVHRLVWYPRASGPRLSPSSIRRRSLSCSNGFRPARPAFFNARRPPLVSCRAQRFTDWRCTPTWRATSASLSPFCSRAAARKRRSSRASKSRLTPAGFPMPRILPAMTGNVTILCEPQ